ncbi:MAG: hypothetical protein J6C46_11545 [Clostridia bacterium]|nr:hypothetical protein [Clostridia bacterium]
MEEKRILSGQDAQIIHEIINEATEKATVNALKIIKKEQYEKEKNRYDRRLHNTELLLRNYRNFKEHIENVNCLDEDIEEINTDMFDIKDDNERVYLNSVSKTRARTLIMIKHMERCLEYYTCRCLYSKKEEVQRRVQVIKMLYINDKRMSYSEIAKELR